MKIFLALFAIFTLSSLSFSIEIEDSVTVIEKDDDTGEIKKITHKIKQDDTTYIETIIKFKNGNADTVVTEVSVIDYLEWQGDEYTCWEKRIDEIGKFGPEFPAAELSPCGTDCPDLVHTEAIIKDISEFPEEGWIFYADADWSAPTCNVYLRRIKSPHSEAIKLNEDGVMDPPLRAPAWWPRWSLDGQWILYSSRVPGTNGFHLWVMKRDLSVNVPLYVTKSNGEQDTLSGLFGGWNHYSPYDDIENGIYDIYYSGKNPHAKACQIDLSSGIPTVVFNSERKIADGITGKSTSGAFAASGGFLLWDGAESGNYFEKRDGERILRRQEMYVPWSENSVNYEPTTLYTIPDGGRGTATRSDRYPSFGIFNCGQDLSFDGTLFIENPGKVVSDCVPNGHHGFGIHKTKKYNEPFVTLGEWWLESENGAVSVNWAPEEIDGFKQWTPHNGNGAYSNYGNWAFTNINEYVTGHNNAGKSGNASHVSPNAECGYIIHWPTHTWYRYTEPGFIPFNAQAYITSIETGNKIPMKRVTPQRISKKTGLIQWTNILGRKMPLEQKNISKNIKVTRGMKNLNIK